MKREEVVQRIRQTGDVFGRIMACLQNPEYVAGYYKAIEDMLEMFDDADNVGAVRDVRR